MTKQLVRDVFRLTAAGYAVFIVIQVFDIDWAVHDGETYSFPPWDVLVVVQAFVIGTIPLAWLATSILELILRWYRDLPDAREGSR